MLIAICIVIDGNSALSEKNLKICLYTRSSFLFVVAIAPYRYDNKVLQLYGCLLGTGSIPSYNLIPCMHTVLNAYSLVLFLFLLCCPVTILATSNLHANPPPT